MIVESPTVTHLHGLGSAFYLQNGIGWVWRKEAMHGTEPESKKKISHATTYHTITVPHPLSIHLDVWLDFFWTFSPWTNYKLLTTALCFNVSGGHHTRGHACDGKPPDTGPAWPRNLWKKANRAKWARCEGDKRSEAAGTLTCHKPASFDLLSSSLWPLCLCWETSGVKSAESEWKYSVWRGYLR